MTFRYSIARDQQLILARFEGDVSVPQFVAACLVICSDERYVRGSDGLIDLTKVAVSISRPEIKELIDFTTSRRKHGDGKWAVLVTSPMATAFTMLYHKGVSHEHPFSLFSTWEGASSFLGRTIDPTVFEEALTSR